MPSVPGRRPRWFQFSLRSLLIGVAVLAVWLGLQADRVRRERQAIAELRKLGCIVKTEPFGPVWLRAALADGYVERAVEVHIDPEELFFRRTARNKAVLTDSALVHLKALKGLRFLALSNSDVTDKGLENLAGLTNLEWLYLHNNTLNAQGQTFYYVQLTDAALVHLRQLTKLKVLLLDGTHVTDAGLENLEGLNSLRQLSVGRTAVTKEGIEDLRRALPSLKFVY